MTDEELKKIQPMVFSIAASIAMRWKMSEVEDLAAEAMAFVAHKASKKFDPSRGAKFSTFVYRCAHNFINGRVSRDVKRDRIRREVEQRHQDSICALRSKTPPPGDSSASEELKIMMNDGTLSKSESNVLAAIMDDPYATRQAIADRLGYSKHSTVSMAVARIKKKVGPRLRELGLI